MCEPACAVRKQEKALRQKLALQEGEGEEEEEEPDDEDAAQWGARKPAYYGEEQEVRIISRIPGPPFAYAR